MPQPVSTKSQNNISLSMPVQFLKGVGPAKAKVFAQLGVETVGDLLEYFPRDWVFTPETIKINQMRQGQTAAVVGLVESVGCLAKGLSVGFDLEAQETIAGLQCGLFGA